MMKKFLIAILIIILIAGAGVGGFFIGKNVKGDDSVSAVTKENVIEVLDNFSYSAGWIEKNETVAKATSNTQEYTAEEVDYKGQEDFIKTMIFVTKYALLNEEVKEKEFYFSSATYEVNGLRYSGNMGLYYEFGENSAFINVYDFDNKAHVVLIVDIQPIQDQKYVLNILQDADMRGQDGFALQQLYMDQYANQIYQYSRLNVQTTRKNLSGITIEDVDNIELYGCDITTHEQIDISKEQIATEQTYTFEALMNVYKEQASRYSGVNFINRDYKQIDALEKAYSNIGYQVV